MFYALYLSVLFCGFTLAQNNGADSVVTAGTKLCFSDMCNFLQEFGVLKENFKTLQTRLKESENQIVELKSKVKEQIQIAFTAGSSGDKAIGPFNIATTLIYNKVTTNVGNAYNQFTGIFVAPVRGIYHFTFFIHAVGNCIMSLSLMKNNQVIVGVYDHKTEHDGADNGGNAAFVQLEVGDQVYVRLNPNSHVWVNSEITTFSGALITQL